MGLKYLVIATNSAKFYTFNPITMTTMPSFLKFHPDELLNW